LSAQNSELQQSINTAVTTKDQNQTTNNKKLQENNKKLEKSLQTLVEENNTLQIKFQDACNAATKALGDLSIVQEKVGLFRYNLMTLLDIYLTKNKIFF
jgi:hypothetical protein